MKFSAAFLSVGALLLASACNQSPQRLVDSGNRYHDKKKYQEASILYRKAIAKDKTFADAYYREGLNLLDQKNPVEAAKFFRRAVDLNPNNNDAEIKLSEIYLTAYAYDQKKFQNLLPEVRELTAKIRERNPKDYHGIRLQALLYLADKNGPKAIETFEEANRIQPRSREVVGWLAETLTASNRFDEAETLMRDMIAHDKTWGPAYDFLFMQYMARKRAADAEAVLKLRVDNDPASDVALANYANFLAQSNRYPQAEALMKNATADTKNFANGRQLLGDFYMRTGHYDQAEAQYRAGLQANPKDKLNYQLHLVSALAREGVTIPAKQVEALNLAKTVTTEHPADAAANEMYASLLLASSSSQGQQKVLEELKLLAQRNPSDAMVHFELARAYYGASELDKSLFEALEAVRIRGSLMTARVLAARIFEDKGQHGKALEQTAIVLEKFPNDPDARLVRGRALLGLKDYAKAQTELEAVVKQNPDFGEAAYQLANLYVAKKSWDQANEQFERLWEGIGPAKQPDLRGFIGLQEVKLRQGRWQSAVQALEDLMQKNPKQPTLRYTLANFQAEAASKMPEDDPQRATLLSQAEANLKEVVQSAKNFPVMERLGTLQRMLKQCDAALASFEEAAKLNPGNPEPSLNRAMLLEQMGQRDKAREAYNRTLGIDPDNVIALNNLAFLEADYGQNLDQAMTFAERAKKRMPSNPNVSDTLGYVYYRKNLTEDAVRELQTAVDADPKNSGFRLHLAMALLKRGDKTGARREAESALRTADSGQTEKIKTFMSQIS